MPEELLQENVETINLQHNKVLKFNLTLNNIINKNNQINLVNKNVISNIKNNTTLNTILLSSGKNTTIINNQKNLINKNFKYNNDYINNSLKSKNDKIIIINDGEQIIR